MSCINRISVFDVPNSNGRLCPSSSFSHWQLCKHHISEILPFQVTIIANFSLNKCVLNCWHMNTDRFSARFGTQIARLSTLFKTITPFQPLPIKKFKPHRMRRFLNSRPCWDSIAAFRIQNPKGPQILAWPRALRKVNPGLPIMYYNEYINLKVDT